MNLVNLRDFLGAATKLKERKYIQEQQPNQIHCYNQNMGFVHRMDLSMPNYRIGMQMKK